MPLIASPHCSPGLSELIAESGRRLESALQAKCWKNRGKMERNGKALAACHRRTAAVKDIVFDKPEAARLDADAD